MPGSEKPSRRDFLQGRAAVQTLAAKAQQLADSASDLLTSRLPSGPIAHVVASRRLMACEFALQYHESDVQLTESSLEALDLIESVEDQLTIYREHSKVSEINKQAFKQPVEVDEELFQLLKLCQLLHQDTHGAFDFTSAPLSRAWGFLQRAGRMPSLEEIHAATAKVNGSKVLLNPSNRTVKFAATDIEINFNSIGKGYALDRASNLLEELGATDFLWHGGGSSVLARGTNRADRMPGWTIGVRHPYRPDLRLLEIHLRDRSLATAGGATQFFEHDGRTYSHIIDPRTGMPASSVLSATVLAPTAALADGLATAFFVMGPEAAEDYCSNNPSIAAVLICPFTKHAGFSSHLIGLQDNDFTRSREFE